VVQELFRGVCRNGYMIEQTTHGAISPSTGRTLPDRYIEGTCPICGADRRPRRPVRQLRQPARPDDLIDPVSKINGETPRSWRPEHFFLDLPALAEALTEWLDDREGAVAHQRHQLQQGPAQGMKPRAMTRDIDWGIPIPVDGWRQTRTSGSTCGSTR
jgi:methionyl-tRNA synthetase